MPYYLPISKRKYEGIFRQAEEIKQNLGIHSRVLILRKEGNMVDGEATHFLMKMISFTKPFLDLYKTENELSLSFILAHELVHIKYNDDRTWFGLTQFLKPKYVKAIILLQEMRANILAANLLKLSDQEIEETQKFLQRVNKNPVGKESYLMGYPDRFQIIDFAKRYKDFTNEVINELLDDFCEVMEIDDSSFKEEVIEGFKKRTKVA